ncbi:MAG: LCP family protein [Candidatus Saccharimonadales bacterium]|jgi:LCP family protein required for cell wall assembly
MQTKNRTHFFAFRRGHNAPSDWQHPSAQLWYELPGYHSHGSGRLVVHKKRVRHSFRVFGVAASVVLTLGGIFSWQMYQQANTVFQGEASAAPARSIPAVPELLEGETEGRINLLVLGTPGEGKPGGDLTDAMYIVSVDPVNHQTKLVSVPKDLWVKMPAPYYGDKQKINVAFAAAKYQQLGRADLNESGKAAMQAGFAGIDQVLSEVLGVRIHYHLFIDGTGLEKAIDSVGGVELDIKRRVYDPMLALENGKNSLLMPAGKQVVSGKKALLYARSQAVWNSSRAERAQQIMAAFTQKAVSLNTLSNPAKLQQIMTALGHSAYSDLTLGSAFRLFGMLKNSSEATVIDLATSPLVVTDKVAGTEVLRPKAGFDSYAALKDFLGAELPDGVLVKENTKITVLAPTRLKAAETAQALRRLGYLVTEAVVPTLSESTASVRLVDLSGGHAAYASRFLSERYGTSVTQAPPTDITMPPGTEFAIILH